MSGAAGKAPKKPRPSTLERENARLKEALRRETSFNGHLWRERDISRARERGMADIVAGAQRLLAGINLLVSAADRLADRDGEELPF